MLGLIDLLTAALPLLYGLTSVNYTVYFLRRDPFAERTCTSFLAGTVAIHIGFVVLLSTYFGRVPVDLTRSPQSDGSLGCDHLSIRGAHRSTSKHGHLYLAFGRDGSIGLLSLAQFEPCGGAASHLFQSSSLAFTLSQPFWATPPFWLERFMGLCTSCSTVR